MNYKHTVLIASLVIVAIPFAASAHNTVNIRTGDNWIATVTYPDVDGNSKVQEMARDAAVSVTHKDEHEFIAWAEGDAKSGSHYEYTSTPTTSIDRADLVSLVWSNSWDIGGEHPTELFDSCSVGLVHGRPKSLALADLFRHDVDPRKASAAAIIAVLKQDHDATDVQEGKLTSSTPNLVTQFYLGDSAITFILSKEITGRYAIDGASTVKVPYSSLFDKLDPSGPLAPLLRPKQAK